MLDRFSPRSRDVMQRARKLAQTQLSPEHILLSLTDEDAGHVHTVLAERGIDRASLTRALQALGPETAAAAKPPLPLSETTQRTLEQACNGAQTLGHDDVAPAHLALGLLEARGPREQQLFEQLQLDAGALHSDLWVLLANRA